MTQDQVLALLRQLATGAAMFAAGRGWITSDQVSILVGAIVAIGSAVWSFRKSSPASQINSVASNPDVKSIVTTKAVASAAPSEKVVPQ